MYFQNPFDRAKENDKHTEVKMSIQKLDAPQKRESIQYTLPKSK